MSSPAGTVAARSMSSKRVRPRRAQVPAQRESAILHEAPGRKLVCQLWPLPLPALVPELRSCGRAQSSGHRGRRGIARNPETASAVASRQATNGLASLSFCGYSFSSFMWLPFPLFFLSLRFLRPDCRGRMYRRKDGWRSESQCESRLEIEVGLKITYRPVKAF